MAVATVMICRRAFSGSGWTRRSRLDKWDLPDLVPSVRLTTRGETTAAETGPVGEHSSSRSKEIWQKHKMAIKTKFPEGWAPRKKLSPDAIKGVRQLHKQVNKPRKFFNCLIKSKPEPRV